MPFPDPVVISGFFLRPGTAGPARVRTSAGPQRADHGVRRGGAWTQGGKEVVRATAAFAGSAWTGR